MLGKRVNVLLTEKARIFIHSKGYFEDAIKILSECLEDGSADALLAVQQMFEDMYDGVVYNSDLKAPAAVCLLRWMDKGLDALIEAAERTPEFKNRLFAISLLSSLSSGGLQKEIDFWIPNKDFANQVIKSIAGLDSLRSSARRHLGMYVLSFDDGDDERDLILTIGSHFQRASMTSPETAKELLGAISRRWLSVSLPVLNAYQDLIIYSPKDEPSFQEFFEQHPQLLDPMALEIWPQPNIYGAKEPDYVIRRTDDSYLVIEIETPAKCLITSSKKLSAEATHAVAQATDYSNFLCERLLSVQKSLTAFRHPECLVVIGMESELSEDQMRALKIENESRHRLRIVGFDWIAKRAHTILDNVVTQGVQIVRNLRIT